MAKIKLQAWLSDVRGKQNGSVFSKNRFANYIRTKTTPINRDTSYQQGVRFNFATLSSGWRSLSAANQNAWRAVVDQFKRINSLADSIQLTGAQLYISLNRNLKNIDIATISTAPALTSVVQLTTLSMVAETTTNTIENTFTGDVYASQSYEIKATAPYSAGKTFVKNQSFLIRILKQEFF